MKPMPIGGEPVPDDDDGMPFSMLRDTGLLWLINRCVFHPRGYALALHYTEQCPQGGGTVTGWSLAGDGTEPWTIGPVPDELQALGHPTEDELFQRVKEILR